MNGKPHKSKGRPGTGSTGQNCDGFLRIATNLMDVPTEIVALLYHYRWTIEIFFRFFKHMLGCRHLLSHSQNGIEIQTYCVIIACMLISLWTGRKPTLRTYEMICWYFCGMADDEELLSHVNRLPKHKARFTRHLVASPAEVHAASNSVPQLDATRNQRVSLHRH